MSAFTRGDIVVYRVGTGTSALVSGQATAVFLDEYTPGGTLVQSIALPTTAGGSNYALTAAGTQTTEGGLTLSTDGQYLIFTGFNAATGTASVQSTASTSVARVIGEVGADGLITTTTAITTTGTGEIRSAASVDGSAFWFTTSTTGVDYATVGATSHTVVAATPANDRDVAIFGNQLYIGSGSSPYVGISMVGTGLPTMSGQVVTLLTGTSSTNPYQFFFADLSSSVPGVDTLYVADNTSSNGLEKFSLVGGSWVLDNKVTTPSGMIGLTGSVTGSSVNLFITTATGIYALTDSAGYHVADNGAASQIVAAATNTGFRGIAFAPSLASALPTLSIDSPSIIEGNSGTKTLTFTVTASAASMTPITFHYATADGTATSASGDYVAVTDTVGTIAAGSTSTTVSVTINGDRAIEPNEVFTVALSNPSGATIATAAGTGTIVNDDNAGSFSLAGNVLQSEAVGAQTFTVTRSGGDVGAATISYAVAGSGAHPADAADFGGALPSGTVSFADGQTSQTISIPIGNDSVYESDDTYTLTLSNPTAGTIGQATATGTIVNDDPAPPVGAFSLAGDASAAEAAGGVTFTIARSGGSAGTATVDYAVTGSGASPADATDFGGALPHGTITFADGQTSATVTISVSDDHVVEPDETFTLTLSNPTGGASLGSASSATGTIVNDDNAGAFAIAGDVSQSEAAGTQSFTVNRTGGTAGEATISYAVTGSGAHPADGTDFTGGTLPTGTIHFADGQASQTIAISVADDASYESDETYTLTLSNPTAGTLGQESATGTIVNDDAAPPMLSIGNAQVVEGDSGTTALVFTITSSIAAPAGGISFAIATADGTATATSGDYVAQSTMGTIAAGQTTTTFTVVVNGDTLFERNETLLVNLSNPTGATIAQGQGVGTIVNDDAVPDGTTVPIFSTDFAAFTAAGFAPGGIAGGLDSNIWRVVGLSAQPNPAYGFTGPAGNTSAATDDFGRGVISGDPVSAGVYSPANDHALIIQPTGAELDVGGFIEARIQNTSGATATSFDVAFDWAYRNNAARAENLQLAYSTDGTNFTAVSAAAFSTPGTADNMSANFTSQHEAVSITGTVADGGYLYLRWIHASSTGSGSRDEVGIDNVGVTAHLSSIVTASVDDISVTEGNGGTTAATFTITRSNGAGTASVDYTTADGTAMAGHDYQSASGTVSFAVGETSKTVTVLVTGDTVHEADETFSLKLGNAVGLQIPQPSATATIVNDDSGPVAIYDIQGLGHRSPFTGQSIATSGVVTAVRSNGFYLQDPTGDGDVRTSDAIFVLTNTAPTVSVGNAITLTGTVAEYAAATNQLTLTELTNISGLTVTAASVALPDAVVIATDGIAGHRAPPTSIIDDDGLKSYDPTTDGIDFYESLEGMRVMIQRPLVVANTDANGNSFVVASNGVGATGLNDRYGMTISAGDNNPETLKIYEGSGAAGAHSQGDVLNDVTGIVSYYGGRYEVDPTAAVTVQLDRPALARETTTLVGDANHLSYASFNIENFSPRDEDNAPITAAEKVARLAAEIINALHSPNVIGLQEVQDNDGEGAGTDLSGAQNVQRLIDAVAAAGGPTYKYIEVPPTATNISGGAPDGNIRPGFLYDPTQVSFVDGSLRVLNDAAFNGTRKPLLADFVFNGQTFTAIDQHSTSRGGSDPVYSSNQPAIQAGDAARTAQAAAIKSYIDGVLANDPAHQFVVNGDFNGFPYEAALQTLSSDGKLDNLYDKLAPQERYSYYFDGYYQAFDNIIVSHALSANTTFDIIHYNAGFTDGYSVTDHDQALAEIGLARTTGTAMAIADGYATTAAAVLHGTVLANDTGGAGTITVAAIDGDMTKVGTADRLGSGALLTLLANGVFTYDPDGAFSGLAAGATASDHFAYSLGDGSSATVTITITGIAAPALDAAGHIPGTSGNDTLGGTTGADTFDLTAGGNDTVSGGAGNDVFLFGTTLTALDRVNGGSGSDEVRLQGNYTGASAVTLSATTLTGVETLTLLSNGSSSAGYDITTNDATVAAGGVLTVDAHTLAVSESLSFHGAAEKDGSFVITGGHGNDRIDGGAGYDTMVFSYNLSQATNIVRSGTTSLVISGPDGTDTLTGIEALRFANGTVKLQNSNPYVDNLFYDQRHADVLQSGVDPATHYAQTGAKAGYDPNPFFSIAGYLSANQDVAKAGVDALTHYVGNGAKEARDPAANFDTTLYLLHNPDVARAGVNPLQHYLESGRYEGRSAYAAIGGNITANGFDSEYYLLTNPDVGKAGVDPYTHYMTTGWKEGRNPNAYFNTNAYLAANPDVAAAGVNPLQHYHESGWQEGRDPSGQFDTKMYLAANPDVAQAHIDPLLHFLQFGAYELRDPHADGVTTGQMTIIA